MKDPETMKRHYGTGTQHGGAVWEARKPQMKSRWASGVGAGPIRTANYNSAIDQARYKAGDPNHWYNRWREAMSL